MGTLKTLDEYIWVFIGCGGTFYAASPYLAVLAQRYCRRNLLIIDPDAVSIDNYNRQWPGSKLGESKVGLAAHALCQYDAWQLICRFDPNDHLLNDLTSGQPVLAIVNVDNDSTRLQVAAWLADRQSPGIMIVSGCERTSGQCYPGIWMDGEPVCDWRDYHLEVGASPPAPECGCNLQDIQANALTGVLVGLCIEDIAWRLENDSLTCVQEFYWEMTLPPQSQGFPKMWASLALCNERVQEGV